MYNDFYWASDWMKQGSWEKSLTMTRLTSYLIQVTLLTFVEWTSGCGGTALTGPEVHSRASDETRPVSDQPSSTSGATTVITGTATEHSQRDSPIKIELITGEMLEQAGATHVGQSLQDVPGVQLRR